MIVSIEHVADRLADAAASSYVRSRLRVPDSGDVEAGLVGRQSLSPDRHVAARAAAAALLVIDNHPLGPDARAALVVAASKASAGDDRPLVRLYDPRLLHWLSTHLPVAA